VLRPNVVYIFADQWRSSAACYAGDPNVKTPHIDRLARESTRFATAVSNCPICTPYRASLMTGQYPLTTGLFMNDLCLSNRAVSLAQAFAQAGYDTAYVGKWHLDGHGRSAYIPPARRQGFSYWKVLECTHDYWHSAYYDDSPEGKRWLGYDAYAQTSDTIAYLETRSRARPFLLMVSFGPPHNPYHTAPEECQRLYEAEQLVLAPNVAAECEHLARRDLVGYYGHVSAFDQCVGRIDAALHRLGLADDTMLVVTSDHGDSVWSHCTLETRNINKQRPYDESILVPFLLRYPREAASGGRDVTAPFSTPDIMPTLLELAGLDIPGTVEGMSLAHLVRGGSGPVPEAALIAAYAPFADWRPGNGGREYRGVRTERYTYARTLDGPWLLFDNHADPYQLQNLVNQPSYRDLQLCLEEQLRTILAEQGDEFLPAGALCERWGYHGLTADGAIPTKKDAEWYAALLGPSPA
jgi:arylsulfatase A-like enzyme